MSRKKRKQNQNTTQASPANEQVTQEAAAQEQAAPEPAGEQTYPESIMQEPVWTDIDGPQRTGLRIFAVVMALVVTILIAIGAGVVLAMVDLEIKPHNLIAAVNGSDVGEAVQTAREEYESIYAAAQEKITVDLGESITVENTADDPESTEPEATQVVETASSEIAGIGEIISAGTNDIIVYKPAEDGSDAPSAMVINDPNANYPLPFSTVDLSYFDDALFIGDSRMLGFGMYSGLNNATFYAVTSFSIFRYETMPVV